MEPETYYMCINETWVIKNGQDLCRKMASKGYDAELVRDPDPSMGYHVSVYKTKDKNSAINFYNNFNDERWGIAYPFYDREYLSDFLSAVSKEPVVVDSIANQETIAMIPITEAVSDGKNVSEWAKRSNLTTILYLVNKELYMANVTNNGESQSYGPLTIIDSKTEQETSTSYQIDKWTCRWSFENNYDSVKGSCQVFITMINKPTQVSCHIKMIIADGKEIEYYGDVEKPKD